MSKKVAEFGRMNIELQRDLRHMKQVLAARRAEDTRLILLIEETRDEISKLREDSEKIHALRGQGEGWLKELLAESKEELNKLSLQIAQNDATAAESQTLLGEEIRKLQFDRNQGR